MIAIRWMAALALAWPLLAAQAQQHQHGEAAKRRAPPLAMGAAFAPSGALWIVALDAQQRLFTQSSADAGRSWQPPRLLDTGSDKVAADGENRPKLAFGPGGQAVISYTEPLARPYSGQIRMLRSDDGGRSFSPPFTVHQDRQLITHRFESVAFDARGILHTLWIDKRDLELQIKAAAAAAPGAESAKAAAAAASAPIVGGRGAKPKAGYRGAAVYRNESSDGGRSFGPDIKLADHSCECCRIALAPSPDGALVALWRHVFAPNERDHAFAALGAPAPAEPRNANALAEPRNAYAPAEPRNANAPAEPVRASFDRWALDACPHHGPGLAPAAAGGYHAVWFGERAGEARVRYGQLDAGGAPRGGVRPLPDEHAEHAAVLSLGRQLAISWRSFDGQATRWRAWLSQDDGQSFQLKELGSSPDDNDHPLLLAHGGQIHALWRTSQGVRVEALAP